MKGNVQIKAISATETIRVRQPILRPGLPVETCVFKGDELKSTIHLGAYYNDQLIGVVTYMKNNTSIFETNYQYQLRGMAVLSNFQKKGIGKLLLEKGEQILKDKNTELIWCNARKVAVPFYEKKGFTITGNLFNIPGVGPHYVMQKTLD